MDEDYIYDIIENGSWRTYQTLVKKYQNRVFTLCYKIIKNKEEAEEVAQDIFVKSFQELKTLKDRSKYHKWLMKIAYYKSIDRVRRKKVIKLDIDKVSEEYIIDTVTPLTETINQDKKNVINQALTHLDQNESSVITLYYLEDLAVKEIAEITQLSLSNVKILLFRARTKLKKIVTHFISDELEDLLD